MTRATRTEVRIGGQMVDCVSRADLTAMMMDDIAARPPAPRLVFSVNGQGVSMGASDPVQQAHIEAADIRHADGMSIVFASRLFTRTPLPERIATTDFFHDAAAAGEPERARFYFLGASREVVEAAYARARELYPGIAWVGCRDGYFDEADEPAICEEIVASGADVLWVGLGRPKQEAFCVRNAHRLGGVTWLKTCGGLFDFLAGRNSRAPGWMQAMGLEWAYRMVLEPRRLMGRYLVTNTHAIWLFATRSGSVPARTPARDSA